MRDKSHDEQVVRWAEFVKSHPISIWKPEVKKIVDSQIVMANNFYRRILKEKGGMAKIAKLRGIINIKKTGY